MAKLFKEMTKEELVSKQAELQKRYDDFKAMNLKLDMSRESRVQINLICRQICLTAMIIFQTVLT